jgi:uncharacterized protein YjbI with pentapeptide repeats
MRIDDAVDLSHLRFGEGIVNGCVFPDMGAFMSDTSPIAVDLSYATCSNIAFFNDATFSEANFEGTTFSEGADWHSG